MCLQLAQSSKQPLGQVLLSPPFTGKETEAQSRQDKPGLLTGFGGTSEKKALSSALSFLILPLSVLFLICFSPYRLASFLSPALHCLSVLQITMRMEELFVTITGNSGPPVTGLTPSPEWEESD